MSDLKTTLLKSVDDNAYNVLRKIINTCGIDAVSAALVEISKEETVEEIFGMSYKDWLNKQ